MTESTECLLPHVHIPVYHISGKMMCKICFRGIDE